MYGEGFFYCKYGVYLGNYFRGIKRVFVVRLRINWLVLRKGI